MPKPCSLELRERVVDAVESGASRRETAEHRSRIANRLVGGSRLFPGKPTGLDPNQLRQIKSRYISVRSMHATRVRGSYIHAMR